MRRSGKGRIDVKLRIEIEPGAEREVILRAPTVDGDVRRIRDAIEKAVSSPGEIALKSGDGEVFVSHSEIYFFEVSGDKTYAHTAANCYVCPMHLFELEEILPRTFCRASKSILVNSGKIRSMSRSPSGVAETAFSGTEKKIFISRMYYKTVREIIRETRL